MKWASFDGISKEGKSLFALIKNHKRDFSVSELAVLYYRANNKPISRSAMNQNLLHWTKQGLMERTGYGRYRLK